MAKVPKRQFKYLKFWQKEWGISKEQFDRAVELAKAERETENQSDVDIAQYIADQLGHMEWLDDETHPLWDIVAEYCPVDY